MAKGGGDRHQQLCTYGMALIRVFLGLCFILYSINALMTIHKYIASLSAATSAQGVLVKWSINAGYAGFLQHVVQPNVQTVTWGILIASLLVGVLLLIGLLTRLAALLAMPITLLFLLATWCSPAVAPWQLATFTGHFAFLLMELVVLVSAAGRTFGIDNLLARQAKYNILW